ncbi:hypothetical protein [Lacisediminimonas profundi]|uniref:hypothetical protein n=1 Tax=Lacisediminimonas profundi TaxID=2603856 RepID=UPI00124B7B2F|nr:hypothetical protein [Lacisediminimonas profundi]
MSIIHILKAWFCIAWLPMFISDSASTSTTSSTTNNADQRLNLNQGGVGATASSGGSVIINSTDGEVLRQTVDTLAVTHENVLDRLFASFDRMLKVNQDTAAQNTKLATDAVMSYAPNDSGKTELSKNTTIAIGMVALAAALAIFKR